MNYIRHIHAFYHLVQRDDRLSAQHVSLYMAIFQFWNYHRFQNPFRVDRDQLMRLSKIGSKNTYHKCIKELHSYRYIIYHSGMVKYQHVKVSMLLLEGKAEAKESIQPDLFDSKEMVTAGNTPTFLDTCTGTGNGTLPCINNGTARVPFLTAACTGNDTVPVPLLGHNIKQTPINGKPVVVKTEEKTTTTIFENKIDFGNTMAKTKSMNGAEKPNQQAPPVPIGPVTLFSEINASAPPPAVADLSQVEIYFRENGFSIPEAQKFFNYNQGRGWMLNGTLPVKDWQALAQKWMLNSFNPYKKCTNEQHGNRQKQTFDPRPGKDYSEPL